MDLNIATTQPQGLPITRSTNGAENTELRKIAEDFESFYMFQVLQLMQPPMNEDSMFGGGFAEEMFRHTLNEQMAGQIVKRGGVGLADSIYAELTRLQEVK